MPTTPFLGLELPDFDITTWHDDVNGNFTLIDTAFAGASAVATFTALTDTPAAYAGSELFVVRVNAAGTGLEFVASAIAGGTAASTSFTPVGAIAAVDVQAALAELDTEKQPLSSELTAIAGVVSAAYGRSLLTLASAAALAGQVDSFFLTPSEADAAYQPLDSDLTSIAGLSTTAAGRSNLILADPNTDRLAMWDDTAGTMKLAALADLATEAAPAAGDFVLVQRAEDDIVKVNWSSLPGATGGLNNIAEDLTPDLGGDLGTNGFNINFSNGTAARTGVGLGDTFLLQARDVDGASYTTFITLTANNTPTCDMASSVTIGGATIYRTSGTDVAVADGGTGASTVAGARTNLGIGTADSPEFAGINVGHATDTTITRVSAGVIAVEGATLLTQTLAAATYQPLDADLTALAGLATTAAGRSSLVVADPNLDRLMLWDDSAGAMKLAALADLATEAAPASGDFFIMQRAEDDIVKVNWSSLPGSGLVGVASGGTGQTTEAEAIGELTQALAEDTTPDFLNDFVPAYDASGDTGSKLKLSTLLRSRSVDAPIGYNTGAGGVVTQLTSKTTGVLLNTLTGTITTHNSALAAGQSVVFAVTNSKVAATDIVVVAEQTNTSSHLISVRNITAGGFSIRIKNDNISSGTNDAIQINFAVIKGASS